MATHHSFRRVAFILLLMSQTAQLNLAQEGMGADAPAARYRAFDSDGKQVTIQEVVEAFGGADVVLVGEEHDDPTAHLLEAELLRRAHERHGLGAGAKGRPVALSLEMFERDVQLVVDEYLAGLISERHFLASSRPWNNYQVDYRPLVEYARAQKLPVIAANAPARYVSRVSANGPASLGALSEAARATLPPLPFRPASEAYAAKFGRFMGLDAATTPPTQTGRARPPLQRQVSQRGAAGRPRTHQTQPREDAPPRRHDPLRRGLPRLRRRETRALRRLRHHHRSFAPALTIDTKGGKVERGKGEKEEARRLSSFSPLPLSTFSPLLFPVRLPEAAAGWHNSGSLRGADERDSRGRC